MAETYAEMVARLKKPGGDILKDMDPYFMNLMHMSLGLAGECGEVVDLIKKVTCTGKHSHISELIKELGDVEFYLEGLRQTLGVTRDEVLEANMNKLNARYHEGSYSDEQARGRYDEIKED